MVSKTEILKELSTLSLLDRLFVIEEVLKQIRTESSMTKKEVVSTSVLEFSGILDEDEAKIFEESVLESRETEENEW